MEKNVFESVREILNVHFSIPKDEITIDSKSYDFGFDSLDEVEFIMELEKLFGISIYDDEAENLQTIGDVVVCVESKI